MLNDISIMIDIIRNASKFITRDYSELELLQSSNKSARKFSHASYENLLQKLQFAFSKYYKVIEINNPNTNTHIVDFEDNILYIDLMDGISNFTRALPFCGIMVSVLSKKDNKINAKNSIMHFPILNKTYYATEKQGAWVERDGSNVSGKIRCRVSDVKETQNASIATDINHVTIANKLAQNVMLFNSDYYMLGLLLQGKIDVMLTQITELSKHVVQLFIKEAGGILHTQNDLLLASNGSLHEQVKKIL